MHADRMRAARQVMASLSYRVARALHSQPLVVVSPMGDPVVRLEEVH